MEELDLAEGDEVALTPIGKRVCGISRDPTKDEALARIRAMNWRLPADYRFDRDEIYDRFGPDAPGRQRDDGP